MKYKAILFDLGEVLLQGFYKIEYRLADLDSIKTEPNRIRKILEANGVLHALFRNNLSEEEYWVRVKDRADWSLEVADLKEVVRQNFIKIDKMETVLEELKAKGYLLGLISDHAESWIDYCERNFSYHEYFDTLVYSFEVLALKSEFVPFYEALWKLGLDANSCLFIDDNSKNIKSAEEMGIDGLQFKGAQQLRTKLQTLLGTGLDLGAS